MITSQLVRALMTLFSPSMCPAALICLLETLNPQVGTKTHECGVVMVTQCFSFRSWMICTLVCKRTQYGLLAALVVSLLKA